MRNTYFAGAEVSDVQAESIAVCRILRVVFVVECCRSRRDRADRLRYQAMPPAEAADPEADTPAERFAGQIDQHRREDRRPGRYDARRAGVSQ